MTKTWCVIGRSPDNRQPFREIGIDSIGRPALMDPQANPKHQIARVRFADYDSALAFWGLVTFGMGVQGVDSISSGVAEVVNGKLVNVPNDVQEKAE